MRGDTGYAYLPAGQAEVEFGKYEQRIRQLEDLNAKLAAEVDAQRPVVEAALLWNKVNYRDSEWDQEEAVRLIDACNTYESSKPK